MAGSIALGTYLRASRFRLGGPVGPSDRGGPWTNWLCPAHRKHVESGERPPTTPTTTATAPDRTQSKRRPLLARPGSVNGSNGSHFVALLHNAGSGTFSFRRVFLSHRSMFMAIHLQTGQSVIKLTLTDLIILKKKGRFIVNLEHGLGYDDTLALKAQYILAGDWSPEWAFVSIGSLRFDSIN